MIVIKEPIKTNHLFAKCTDCHSDYHKGDFTSKEIVKDCKTCHTEFGFSPSNFLIEDHNKTKFIIDGSHLAVACRAMSLQKRTMEI